MSETTTTATTTTSLDAGRSPPRTLGTRPGDSGPAPRQPPRMLRVGASRIGHETKGYFRSPDAVFFTFLFPLIMLGIFTAAFSASGDIVPGSRHGGRVRRRLLPAGHARRGHAALGRAEPRGRHRDREGRRHAEAPRRHAALAGVLLPRQDRPGLRHRPCCRRCCCSSPALVLGIALPTTSEAWLTFAWVFVLGVATSALCGIALSAVPRSGKSATAVVIPIVLVLQFISGVYLQFRSCPSGCRTSPACSPLSGWRRACARCSCPTTSRCSSSTAHGTSAGVAVALVAWLVIGLVVSRLTFRWIRRDA